MSAPDLSSKSGEHQQQPSHVIDSVGGSPRHSSSPSFKSNKSSDAVQVPETPKEVHWWHKDQLRETLRWSNIVPAFVTRCKDCLIPDLSNKPKNPFGLIFSLNHCQRLTFAAAWMAWMVDAIDFFGVSMTVTEIAKEFGKKSSDVTSAITVTLMLRPIGALIFGVVADRYGRRIPLMVDLFLFTIIELCSGFANSLSTFIGLRAVFGICMGGEWGLGNALAMETLPVESRGVFSGILQEGYACGYLVAALIYYAVVPNLGWRAFYWISIIPAVATLILVWFVPETDVWKQNRVNVKAKNKRLYQQTLQMLKRHWLLCIYAICLMAGFNFMSHGSQDLYPTFLKTQPKFSAEQATVATVVMNIGAIIGGSILGYLSEYIGRRFTIIWACLIGLCFVPLWMLPRTFGLLVFGSFMIQIFVQGAWGVIPVHLAELSPEGFRSTFPGLAYQLGNLIDASASQIEASLGEKNPLPNGEPDYAKTQMTLLCIIFAVVAFLTFIGTEQRAKDFSQELAAEEKEIDANDESIYETKSVYSNDSRGSFGQEIDEKGNDLDKISVISDGKDQKKSVNLKSSLRSPSTRSLKKQAPQQQ
ncbi:Carboxylic acid transporter [Mycoemilia scoparia]|uniref:Carboxylic acid transporter n=1 Tax=Mycoemilia scoparia TaxID=417184 RepID=A0A9W8DW38_9FUNG|nr:Carboxylic acid transporter [Mycoemilia scoparia]